MENSCPYKPHGCVFRTVCRRSPDFVREERDKIEFDCKRNSVLAFVLDSIGCSNCDGTVVGRAINVRQKAEGNDACFE